jgi:regulator of replication initiation timing
VPERTVRYKKLEAELDRLAQEIEELKTRIGRTVADRLAARAEHEKNNGGKK